MRMFFCFAFKLRATGILCFLSWFIYGTETDTEVLYKRTNLDPDLFCACRELPGSRETGNLVDGFVGCRYLGPTVPDTYRIVCSMLRSSNVPCDSRFSYGIILKQKL